MVQIGIARQKTRGWTKQQVAKYVVPKMKELGKTLQTKISWEELNQKRANVIDAGNAARGQ